MFIEELKEPVARLRGVGPAVRQDLARLGASTLGGLLLHLPRDYIDRSVTVPLLEARNGKIVNTVALVRSHEYFGRPPKRILKIVIQDDTEAAELLCFNRNFLAQTFVPGLRVRVAGKFELQRGRLAASAFELEPAGEDGEAFSGVLPVYPLTGRLNQKLMRRLLRQAVQAYALKLEDDLPDGLRRSRNPAGFGAALAELHFPGSPAALAPARRGLAFDELFHFHLRIGRQALERKTRGRAARELPRGLQKKLVESLPFSLTEDQLRSGEELYRDACSAHPMARLLQGDVGSGKTLVAFLAALPYIESGRQAAFMAPTELLARQHAENAARLLEPLGVRLAFFSGSVPAKSRKPFLAALAAGELDLVLGTHALFTDEVGFKDLGFAVIDEQQRFGVAQRERLAAKGFHPDLLLMSATPIPRTLALTVFGDMDTSVLAKLPAGRKPIETHLAAHGKEEKVYEWVRRELAQGRQAYFVYPVIGEEGALEQKSAESMYEQLRTRIFPDFPGGLIHSRLDEEVKRETMAKFGRGELKFLAATSVVEVGVDVPNATCMVVEHAERFGLAALHQLRGRVGRGGRQSYAFLLYDPELSELAKQRLKVIKETSDGFELAEQDLLLRGPGDLLGLRQAGLLDFSFAQLPADNDLLIEARREALAVLEKDPGLLAPEHAAVGRRLRLQT